MTIGIQQAVYLNKYKEADISQNSLNETAKKYFLNISNAEIIKFKACIQTEDLVGADYRLIQVVRFLMLFKMLLLF